MEKENTEVIKVAKEKSKYSSLSEWRKADPNAYAAAYRRGMLIKIAEHFGWELPKTRVRKK